MATIGGSNIVRSGLVLNLDAASPRSYPGSGTSWRDVSGNNNNGTLTNGPTFSSANAGSIVFDGVNDFVSGPQLSVINGTAAKSLEVWFRPTMNDSSTVVQIGIQGNVGQDFEIVCTAENDTGGSGTNIPAQFKALGGLYAALWARDIYIPLGYTSSLKDRWVHAVLTFDTNSQTALYYNGTLPAALSWVDPNWSQTLQTQPFTFTSINTSANNPSYIGRSSTSTPWGLGQLYFSGNIPIVRVYNRALSASEVLQNYNSTKTRFDL